MRSRTRLEIISNGVVIEIYAFISATPFIYGEKPLVLLVVEDISEIAELRQLIPICSVCKKVRDDTESWLRLESYFKDRWDVDFTHGLCPDCHKDALAKLQGRSRDRQRDTRISRNPDTGPQAVQLQGRKKRHVPPPAEMHHNQLTG